MRRDPETGDPNFFGFARDYLHTYLPKVQQRTTAKPLNSPGRSPPSTLPTTNNRHRHQLDIAASHLALHKPTDAIERCSTYASKHPNGCGHQGYARGLVSELSKLAGVPSLTKSASLPTTSASGSDLTELASDSAASSARRSACRK